MDNYPTLKRPKKKLIYPPVITRPPGQWTKDIITLEDVDKMFDDLVEDFPSPSPEIHIANKYKHIEREVTPLPPQEEQLKGQMVANGDNKHQQYTSASPELNIVSETPFRAHRPIKTSSPIEGNVIQHENNPKNKEDNSASPILFDCEDKNHHLETAETPCNNYKRDESEDSIFETLPKKPVLSKVSAQKKKTTPARLKPTSPLISPVRKNELKAVPATEKFEHVQVSTKDKRNMTTFLQKLRDAGQPKTGLTWTSQAKVIPPEPEPEDDFLILEEDVPFCVSIPNKYSRNMNDKPTKTSSSDTEAKDTSGEKHQDIEEGDRQQESQAMAEKTNKKKGNEGSESNTAVSDKDHPVLANFESVENKSDRGQTKKKKKQSKDDNKPEDTGTESEDGFSPKRIMKGKKTGIKRSKQLKNYKENKKEMSTAKENRREKRKANTLTVEVEVQNQELSSEHQLDNKVPVSVLNTFETQLKGKHKHSSQEETSDENIMRGKRKRKQPGEWWIGCPQSSEQQATETQQNAASSVQASTGGGRRDLKSSSSSDSQKQKTKQKLVKKEKLKRKSPVMTPSSVETNEDFDQCIQDRALDQDSDSDSSPLLLPHREHSIISDENAFPKLYQKGASEKKSSSNDCATSAERGPGSWETTKQRRKSPGNQWHVIAIKESKEVSASQPQKQNLKKSKPAGENKRAEKSPAYSSSEPLEGASKQKKRSLAAVKDLCSTVVMSPHVNKDHVQASPAENIESEHNIVSIHMDELQGVQDLSLSRDSVQEGISKVIRSGPSSMIELNYEEDEVLMQPSTTMQPVLCASDLCCAPLRPLILQPKDKVMLQDWLKSLWPVSDRNSEIKPDHFEWYCHRGKAMGILVDLHTSSICNGKMLLGSFMKKPLWVDHTATTVFNLLTSSVSVVVDCNKSDYIAGQSFIVPPGHAYSLYNPNAQPAVLYFTRVFTEVSDE